MKNNKNVIMLLLICLSLTQIVTAYSLRPERQPVEPRTSSETRQPYTVIENTQKSSQPSTAQKYAMQTRDTIGAKTGIKNLGIIDNIAGTKDMSLQTASNRNNLSKTDEYTYNENNPLLENTERSDSISNTIDEISPQLSTAQRYAIQAREKIGQFSPFKNQGMIDAIAGTKGMSSPGFRNEKISRPDENGIELITMNSKSDNQSTTNTIPKASKMSQNEQDFDFLNEWENWANESNNNAANPTTILQTTTSPFFQQSREHLNINNTPPTTASFLEKTSDVINTWILETASAYSKNQNTAKTAWQAATLTSANAQRPAADQIKINNQEYTQFLKEITYTDLFKNLTTSNVQSRSNGYAETNSIQPIVTDIVNKMLLDMQIPQSVLTSPRFVNQQFKAMQTNFANQMQSIVSSTKLTLQEKQTQINQALTNLSQNVKNFVKQLSVKTPEMYTVTSEIPNPLKPFAYSQQPDYITPISPIRPVDNTLSTIRPAEQKQNLSTPYKIIKKEKNLSTADTLFNNTQTSSNKTQEFFNSNHTITYNADGSVSL